MWKVVPVMISDREVPVAVHSRGSVVERAEFTMMVDNGQVIAIGAAKYKIAQVRDRGDRGEIWDAQLVAVKSARKVKPKVQTHGDGES